MGKPTGFLEIERHDRPYEKLAVRRRSWKEFVKPLPEPETRKQAARCMDCGIPFCHDGCPVNNLIPDWNNLVYRDQWQTALTDAALDQQFSGIHRPHLPGAVRGGLHAQHRRQPGHDQDDRMRDRRPRLGGGLDRARGAGPADRQAGRGRRLGAGRPGLRAATGARRPRGDPVREERPHRRAAALRHPRFQDGKAPDRPPRRRRWRPRGSSSAPASRSGSMSASTPARENSTRWR